MMDGGCGGNRAGFFTTYCAGLVAPATKSTTTACICSVNYGTYGSSHISSADALNQSKTKTYHSRLDIPHSLVGRVGRGTNVRYPNFVVNFSACRWGVNIC
jgi:hypothetical protein